MLNSNQILERIDYWYNKGDKASESWYLDALSYCNNLSLIYNVPVRVVAGVLASLSVLKRWEQNKEITEVFFECQECKHTTTQAKKADAIYGLQRYEDTLSDIELDRLIMEFLGGEKTKAFYHCIVYPQTSGYVCLDSHMLKAFNNGNLKPSKNQYQALSNYFIQKAFEYQIPISALQARIWVEVRKKENSRLIKTLKNLEQFQKDLKLLQ